MKNVLKLHRLISVLIFALAYGTQALAADCRSLLVPGFKPGAAYSSPSEYPLDIATLNRKISARGMMDWEQSGGMHYSYSGNSFGPITRVRLFPFSLAKELTGRSKFSIAIAAKISKNYFDLPHIRRVEKDLGPVTLRTLSGHYVVGSSLIMLDSEDFRESEVKGYRAMYRYIKMTMTEIELQEIAKSWMAKKLDREIARWALALNENDFAYHLAATGESMDAYMELWKFKQ